MFQFVRVPANGFRRSDKYYAKCIEKKTGPMEDPREIHARQPEYL
jgi:hypothetical protein